MNPKEYIRKVASHYPDSDSIKRILEFSSVDVLHIDIDGKPLNIWHEAFKETSKQGKLSELISNAASEYPSLKLSLEEEKQLEDFLSAPLNGITEHSGILKWLIGILLFFGLVILGYILVKKDHPQDLVIVLHKPGNRTIHPLSSIGILKLQDTTHHQNLLNRPIREEGVVKINNPPEWMYTGKIRMDLQGLDNDSVTYSISSRIYSLGGNDTVWVEVAAVPKYQGPPLTSFDFVRLRYGAKEFDFLSSKSSLQLKKYMIMDIDHKTDLFADRHVLRYLGDELANEKLLSGVNWTENRNLQLEYKMVPVAMEKFITLRIDDVNLKDAIVFFGGEVGRISESSRSGSKIILPRIVGTNMLEIFYKDSMAVFPVRTGYSDAAKFITREEFLRNSKKINKRVK